MTAEVVSLRPTPEDETAEIKSRALQLLDRTREAVEKGEIDTVVLLAGGPDVPHVISWSAPTTEYMAMLGMLHCCIREITNTMWDPHPEG